MKWRCSRFVLLVGMAGFIAGCCADAQPKTSATESQPATLPPQAQAQKVVPPPAELPRGRDVKVLPPPTALQVPPGPPPQAFGTPPQPALENFLKFDTEHKEVSVTNGTPEAHFSFNLTNISSGPVIINYVQTSCGCTVAKLPSQPWKLSPDDHGEISATMQLAGTPPGGTKTKTLTVNSDHGTKLLLVAATVLPQPASMSAMDRTNNVMAAKADRQAVFKGDCMRCHVAPAKDSMGHDKMGQELYMAVCGVCHEAEHQASFVPNLHRLPEPTSAEFWRNWILHGKAGTLMPAFAKSEGGFLTDQQTESLVQYLTTTIPSHPVVVPPPAQLKMQ
jgi:mono/diheme cytochrome c family protein